MTIADDFSDGYPILLRRLDTAIQAIFAAMLVFLPFAFGATQPWSQEIFLAAATVLVVCVLARPLIQSSIVPAWNWTYIPILAFILLAIGQLIAWPQHLVSAISPHTTDLRNSLLGTLPAAGAALSRQTLTLYPQATTENLRLILGVAGIFFVVNQFTKTERKIEQLLLVISITGFCVSLLAVWQNITGTTTIYGLVPVGHKNSGPFQNYSHYSQFMNLSIGASLGLGLMRWMSVLRETGMHFRSMGDVKQLMSHERMRLVNFLSVAVLIEATTIFLCMSRMGIISFLIAGALTGVLIAWRGRSKDQGSVMLILGILILATLLCVGFDAVYDRLATVRQVETTEGGRLEMLRDMSAEFKSFPLLGTGLGTHEYVFPMFDRSNILAIRTHAEDEFAQLLEESGAIGMVCCLTFLGLIAKAFWKCVRRPERPIQYAAFGLGFGLSAILIHSFSDFGQHVPANACLTACFAALLINISRIPAGRSSRNAGSKSILNSPSVASASIVRPRPTLCVALTAVTVAAGAWCVSGTDSARQANESWDTALIEAVSLRDRQWNGSDTQFIALLAPAIRATQMQPQNVKYRYLLDLFRWRSLARTSYQNSKGFKLRVAAVPFVAQIVDDLHGAELLCPTFGQNYSLDGELEYFVLHQQQGIAQVKTGYKLNPKDPSASFIVGRFALDDHRWEDALAAFQSAALAGGDKREAIALCVKQADRPALAYRLAAGDSTNLQYLITLLGDSPENKEMVTKCQSDLLTMLQSEADRPDASGGTIASLAEKYAAQHQTAKAIEYYKKATALDYANVDWHFRLATLLADAGNNQAGMAEARVCLRIRPQMKEAETLLGNLSLLEKPDAAGKAN